MKRILRTKGASIAERMFRATASRAAGRSNTLIAPTTTTTGTTRFKTPRCHGLECAQLTGDAEAPVGTR